VESIYIFVYQENVMHPSNIDVIKEVKLCEPPKAFQRLILTLAAVVVSVLLIIAMMDSEYLPW
jgi:hypothetical protein